MKTSTLAAMAAFSFAAAAAAQQAPQQPVETPPGRDRTNQISFDKADSNKDGEVNREEGNMIAGFDFSRADTNHDLTLSRAEFDAAMARSTSRGDGDPGPRSGDRTARVTFESVDTNKDGKVDSNEAAGIPGFNFTSADVDDNHSVSRQEFQTAMANARPRG